MVHLIVVPDHEPLIGILRALFPTKNDTSKIAIDVVKGCFRNEGFSEEKSNE
jgi:hypothetical protein